MLDYMDRYNSQNSRFKSLVKPTNRLMPLYVNIAEDNSLHYKDHVSYIKQLVLKGPT